MAFDIQRHTISQEINSEAVVQLTEQMESKDKEVNELRATSNELKEQMNKQQVAESNYKSYDDLVEEVYEKGPT